MTDEQVVHELRQQLKAVSESLSAARSKKIATSEISIKTAREASSGTTMRAKHLVQSASRLLTFTYANE